MTKDEMMLAFRMLAMGRPATPHVEQLADLLLRLQELLPLQVSAAELAASLPVAVPTLEVELPDSLEELKALPEEAKQAISDAASPSIAAKRGRKPKAE